MIYVLPILYLLFSLVCWKDVKVFCWLMASLMFIDSSGVFSAAEHFFYWIAFTDLLIIAFSFVLPNLYRRYIIIGLSVISLSLNLYEALSFYQTVFYPYYNYIQFFITEAILVTTIYKATRVNYVNTIDRKDVNGR